MFSVWVQTGSSFDGHPAIAVTDDARMAILAGSRSVTLMDLQTKSVVRKIDIETGTSFDGGVGVAVTGQKVVVAGSRKVTLLDLGAM